VSCSPAYDRAPAGGPIPQFDPYDEVMTTDPPPSLRSPRIDGTALEGVSATTLWTLHNRGTEAKRSDGVIRDPWAVTLLDTISYDYLKFGKPNQSHGLRAVAFDVAARQYLTARPKASVVALAEGLQTSFWRLDRTGAVAESTWYSIDLPPVMELRSRLLPSDDRIVDIAQSALDRSWMDRVDARNGVFITAEGLLMYLEPEDALGLIADCAARFPGGQMMFDSIPRWFSNRTLKGFQLSSRYIAPPMPFGQSADEALAMAGTIPGVRLARDVALPPGRGLWRLGAASVMNHIGPLRRNRPSITLLEFG
jgi:O-methyltransferase involved in polyketide biosynthesis